MLSTLSLHVMKCAVWIKWNKKVSRPNHGLSQWQNIPSCSGTFSIVSHSYIIQLSISNWKIMKTQKCLYVNCLHTVHITEVGKLFEIHFLWAISPLLDNTVKSDGKAGKRARGKTCSKGPGLELTPLWQMDARSACKRNQTGSNFIIMTHY